jgi:transglutaminase-like putative cysteine protease
MSWADALNTPVRPVSLDTPQVFDLPAFDHYKDPRKLDVIARIAETEGRDPRLATLAVQIFRNAGVEPRDYIGQAAALLKFVQERIYYVNEPDERLQTPTYTLRVGYGDCDDGGILYYALCRSVRLPVKLVISGVTASGKKVRYHQGDKRLPSGVNWAHVYTAVGDRPYGEPQWRYADPSLKGAPLGWDVVSGDTGPLLEMGGKKAYGIIGAELSALSEPPKTLAEHVLLSVGIGVLTVLASEIVRDYYRNYRKSK